MRARSNSASPPPALAWMIWFAWHATLARAQTPFSGLYSARAFRNMPRITAWPSWSLAGTRARVHWLGGPDGRGPAGSLFGRPASRWRVGRIRLLVSFSRWSRRPPPRRAKLNGLRDVGSKRRGVCSYIVLFRHPLRSPSHLSRFHSCHIRASPLRTSVTPVTTIGGGMERSDSGVVLVARAGVQRRQAGQ